MPQRLETPTIPSPVVSSPSPVSTETVVVLLPTLQPPTPAEEFTRVPTQPPVEVEVCSPVDGLALNQLAGNITNPYNPPPPGSDDPHQGIDVADFLAGSRIAVKGRGVNSILRGRVAGVLNGDFPFGFGLIIETPFEAVERLLPVTPISPGDDLRTTLTCPDVTVFEAAADEWSFYVLYAHLDAAPIFGPGDEVLCGEPIGAIGDSGNALNPHVHIEVRVGRSGLLLDGMSHYNPSATAAEMDAYCLWRVSGQYQLLDPGELLFFDVD